MKFDPLSVMMLWGTPNLLMIDLMKSLAFLAAWDLIGTASIHLVKLSTATIDKCVLLVLISVKVLPYQVPIERKAIIEGSY